MRRRLGLVLLLRLGAIAPAVCLGQQAWAKDLAVRGLVRDSASRAPVAGATVTASGNQSRADEITDDQGFFRLKLPSLNPGALFRLRVEKDGYAVYDRQVVSSEEIPLDVPLVRKAASAGPRPGGAASRDPVLDALLVQLKNPDWQIRIGAVTALAKRMATDRAATNAIVGALGDNDLRVQARALEAIAESKTTSPAAITGVKILLNSSSDDVRITAAATLGALGPRARPAVPELLLALGDRSLRVLRAVVNALITLGEERNPRVVAALVNDLLGDSFGRAMAVQALSRQPAELVPWIPKLIARLRAAQDRNDSGALISVLYAAGPAGRQGLIDLLSGLDAAQQLEVVLRALEVEPSARQDVLRAVPSARLSALLSKQLDSGESSFLPLADGVLHADMGSPTEAVRAAVAILALDLEPYRRARSTFDSALLGPSSLLARYALESLPRLPPARTRDAVSDVVRSLVHCASGAPVLTATDAATKPAGRLPAICRENDVPSASLSATLGRFGDDGTLAMLGPLADHPDPRLNAIARGASRDIKARLALPAAPKGVAPGR